MVIISIAFTVLPKILQMATKVSTYSLKEEAMYNAITYMGLIRSMAWDEKNIDADDILLTAGEAEYDCNQTTGYRKGGFLGSRNCQNTLNASTLPDRNGYDDMDDFNDIDSNNTYNSRSYTLHIEVGYVTDIPPNTDMTFSSTSPSSGTTNSKKINISVTVNQKQSELGNSFVHLSFIAHNIGQQRVQRRNWN